MRKKEREITDLNSLYNIAKQGDVLIMAFNNGIYPYILPVNYGCELKNNILYFYFHGATEGTKYKYIEENPRLSFEVDCNHELITNYSKGYCSMSYSSIIGKGIIRELVEYSEINNALNLLVKQYHKDDNFKFNPAAISRTRTFEIKVTSITGKEKK